MTLLDSIDIGLTGLVAHGARLEVHAKNIANIDTPNYVRKIPILMAKEDISFPGLLSRIKDNVFKVGAIPPNPGGVSMTGIVEDPTLGDLVYAPGHPDADENGYIRKSNVNPLIDMSDANMTTRAYEASIAVINMSKAMAQRAAEIGK